MFDEKQIKSFLDLDTWDRLNGVASVDTAICPYCNRALTPDELLGSPSSSFAAGCAGEPQQGRCRGCWQTFFWHHARSPLGRAWQTWNCDPRRNHVRT